MIQTEPTPNPDSLKFISEKTISAFGTEEFQKSKMNEISNLADIMIGKQRHGPTGNVKVEFEAMYTKFKDLENK